MRPKNRPPYTGQNRRVNKRFPFWAVASCSPWNSDPLISQRYTGNDFFASGINISRTGMLLETYEKMNPGSYLSVKVNSEDGLEVYRFLGKVVHSGKGFSSGMQGLGLQFIKRPKSIKALVE